MDKIRMHADICAAFTWTKNKVFILYYKPQRENSNKIHSQSDMKNICGNTLENFICEM